jgi:hypothetical protein
VVAGDVVRVTAAHDALRIWLKTDRADGGGGGKSGDKKGVLVSALASAFSCRDEPGGGGVPPAVALEAFKLFCDSTQPPLVYAVPRKAWAPGLRPVVKPPKLTIQQALASAPDEAKTIQCFGTLPWDPKQSPFNKPL